MSLSTSSPHVSWRRPGLALLLVATLTGCATSSNPKDPYEGFNRTMFKFNDTLDQVALKPAATVYKRVLPSFVQTGVGNFFGNLDDLWNSVNNLLQGKGEAGMSDATRLAVNSTVGIGGLFDVASKAGLPKHNEDFGQTLGVWGFKSGPYLMLPLLGPSTLRDTAALPLDSLGDPWHYVYPVSLRNIGTVTRVIDKRAALLDASNLLEDAALDRYEFVRDSYLQRRESRVNDGASRTPPRASEDDDDVKNASAAEAVEAEAADAPLLPVSSVSSDSATQELTVDTHPVPAIGTHEHKLTKVNP